MMDTFKKVGGRYYLITIWRIIMLAVSIESRVARYYANVFLLVKSLVIKHEPTVRTVNNSIRKIHGNSAVSSDPLTWQYYLHLSGEYHGLDDKIYVTSIDDGSQIEYSITGFTNHPRSLLRYQQNRVAVIELIELYPHMETFIKGVLHPIDINVAIAAANGDIIYYDKSLVEPREDTLIHDMSVWIAKYMSRWYVDGFSVTDSLYQATWWGILFQQLVTRVLLLRLDKCHTPQVHSFHMEMFLASHFGLDRESLGLQDPQQLWLYRNIRFLERNPGKNDTFQRIVDNLVTPEHVGLSQFTYGQPGVISGDIASIHTSKDPITLEYNAPSGSGVTFTPEQTLDVQLHDKAVYNAFCISKDNGTTYQYLRQGGHFGADTRVLDSHMVDYGDMLPHTRVSLAVEHWVYTAYTGEYDAIIVFTDSNTGSIYKLSAKDAWLLYLYMISREYGFTPDLVPLYYLTHISHANIDVNDLLSLIPDGTDIEPAIVEMAQTHPERHTMGTTLEFIRYIDLLVEQQVRLWLTRSTTSHMHNRAYLGKAINRMFFVMKVSFPETGDAYADTLSRIGISFPDGYDFTKGASELLAASTGITTSNTRTLDVQQATMTILRRMSSYRTQIINRTAQPNVAQVSDSLIHNDLGLTNDYMVYGTTGVNGPASGYDIYNGFYSLSQAQQNTLI